MRISGLAKVLNKSLTSEAKGQGLLIGFCYCSEPTKTLYNALGVEHPRLNLSCSIKFEKGNSKNLNRNTIIPLPSSVPSYILLRFHSC